MSVFEDGKGTPADAPHRHNKHEELSVLTLRYKMIEFTLNYISDLL